MRLPPPRASPGPPTGRSNAASSDVRCSTNQGGPVRPWHSPTIARPSAAPGTRPREAARKVPTSGPGTSARPSSSKTTAASAQAEPGAGRLGERQREDTGLAQGGPVVGRDGALVAFARPDALEREPPGQQGPDALGQVALGLADAEVHQRALGRPRMRSATMLRCTCEVPAAMVRLIDLNQLCTCSALPIGAASVRQRVGAQRGRVEHLHGQVAQRLRVLGERQLEHRPADAGHARLRRLGDVALGQRPQRVEGGPEVPDAPRAGRCGRRGTGRAGSRWPAARRAAAWPREARPRRPCRARTTA